MDSESAFQPMMAEKERWGSPWLGRGISVKGGGIKGRELHGSLDLERLLASWGR